jgi:predicted transposase YdaD
MFEYDKSGKWYIQHHGDSILRIFGVRDIASWTAAQAELVLPRQLSDGVLRVLERGRTEPDIYILEIAAYPDARVPSQAVRDAALGFLERNILPEVLVLFLHEKGNVPAADSIELRSRKGFTTMRVSWRAVKLWELPAEELLALGDVALVPWVPLAKHSGPPEPIVRRCRARIDHETSSPERENLLTVTQFLLRLRYTDRSLLQKLRELLGGREVLNESLLYQDIVEEAERNGEARARRQDILEILEDRFGPQAKELEVELKATEFDRLRELLKLAARSRSLAAFRKRLLSS